VIAFVDTNVLVRHLTGDPPAQAVRATRYLELADELLLPDLILAEVAYVLESFYETPRAQVAETLRRLSGRERRTERHRRCRLLRSRDRSRRDRPARRAPLRQQRR